MSNNPFADEVAAAIKRHYPDLGDSKQNAAVCATLADAIGGALAVVYELTGDEGGEDGLNFIMARVRHTAKKIQAHAHQILQNRKVN